MGSKHKKNKRVKKEKEYKTMEERQAFYDTIRLKIEVELGLGVHLGPIAELYELLENYVETGNGKTGKIRFPEAKRTIMYGLTNTKNVENLVQLKYVGY